jgi:hypothetical protein
MSHHSDVPEVPDPGNYERKVIEVARMGRLTAAHGR